ncbi:MAG: hypothetical protein HY896_02290 [Deltaproteobacteria bacterium]|nr:hypothetical protein [Deltaproteobacteria bacterium]
MKKSFVFSILFAGIFLAASAGIALADMMTEEAPAWETYQGEEVYGPTGSFQFEGAVETGSLPPGEDLSEAQTGVTDEFPIYEAGGLPFRVGIDSEP